MIALISQPLPEHGRLRLCPSVGMRPEEQGEPQRPTGNGTALPIAWLKQPTPAHPGASFSRAKRQARGDRVMIAAHYPSAVSLCGRNAVWADRVLMHATGYESVFPVQDAQGLVVDL
jgi:hypothetical protein